MRIKSGDHTQYRCTNRCVGGSIYENRATAELAEEFVALQDEGVAGYVPQQENRERERVAREIAEGEGALGQMEEERLRLARLVVRGSLSEGEYDLLLGEIESKAAGLASRLEMARQRRIDLEDVERRVIRLQEVVEAGPGVLAGEDERAVNSWLRKHLRAYVVGNHVAAVEWI